MSSITNPQRSDLVFVLRLCDSDPAAPPQGCLEHVLSGRRHDFDTGAALLDCLAHEQRQMQRAPGVAGAATTTFKPTPNPKR